MFEDLSEMNSMCKMEIERFVQHIVHKVLAKMIVGSYRRSIIDTTMTLLSIIP